MQTGIRGFSETVAAENCTASAMGSGALSVFATPAMIALIEEAAWKSVQPELEEGQATVGTKLQIEHLAATPVGMKVRAETVLKQVDGRRLVFSAEVFDEAGLIGKGEHERFIVYGEKFEAKARAKRQ